MCPQVLYGASSAWTEPTAWGGGSEAAPLPGAASAAAAPRPELELLARQVLDELVRDGLWGVPTAAPPRPPSGEAPERRLTPQVTVSSAGVLDLPSVQACGLPRPFPVVAQAKSQTAHVNRQLHFRQSNALQQTQPMVELVWARHRSVVCHTRALDQLMCMIAIKAATCALLAARAEQMTHRRVRRWWART